MMLNESRKKRDAIKALSGYYVVERIRVFGSVALGEERPDRDVAFLVDLPRGYDLVGQRLPLIDALARLLNFRRPDPRARGETQRISRPLRDSAGKSHRKPLITGRSRDQR
jgi:predicted nucleotidyltransferase